MPVDRLLGTPLAARLGIRATALLGLIILVLGTAALLRVTATTPAWVTALILCGRGLASGLTIQPVLTVMIGGLAPAEIPDGNTLFNVAQRLGGSLGIPLLGTFYALRERMRVDAALRALGLPVAGNGQGGLGASGARLPAPVRAADRGRNRGLPRHHLAAGRGVRARRRRGPAAARPRATRRRAASERSSSVSVVAVVPLSP